jgi:hypothetical protein
MPDKSLGRMAKVDLREVWQSEAGGFTPWLATEDNLSLLADTIGVELELEATEKDVSPLRAEDAGHPTPAAVAPSVNHVR